jgi:CubicO group peptidase (beta-lactamase class C family)
MSKAWSALQIGVMEFNGLISVDETLGDIFSDPTAWAQSVDADARKNITLEYLLQMRAGLTMPE